MAERLQRHVHCLLGLPFDEVDMAGAVSRVRDAAGRRERCFLSTPNLNWLAACLNDPAFRGSVIRSDLSIPDGTPLIWIAKLLGIPLRERVAGSTLFEILRRDNPRKIAVFFFGGPDGAAEAACRRLNHEGRGLAGAGYESPGFGSVEDMSTDAIVGRINASHADFLVVALGARKGQAWIERNLERLNVPVVSHLGAVVNFVAGTARRVPVWTQRAGLEWLWRIKEEPDLWRRYFLDGMVLLRLLVTRVLPHAWFISRHAPGPRELAAATFESRDTEGEISIHLRGAWVRQNLAAAQGVRLESCDFRPEHAVRPEECKLCRQCVPGAADAGERGTRAPRPAIDNRRPGTQRAADIPLRVRGIPARFPAGIVKNQRAAIFLPYISR